MQWALRFRERPSVGAGGVNRRVAVAPQEVTLLRVAENRHRSPVRKQHDPRASTAYTASTVLSSSAASSSSLSEGSRLANVRFTPSEPTPARINSGAAWHGAVRARVGWRVSGRGDLDVTEFDGCAAAQRVRDLRDRVDVRDELLKLLLRGFARDLDVVGDVLRDGRVAVELADDTDSNVRQPDAAGPGLSEQVV